MTPIRKERGPQVPVKGWVNHEGHQVYAVEIRWFKGTKLVSGPVVKHELANGSEDVSRVKIERPIKYPDEWRP